MEIKEIFNQALNQLEQEKQRQISSAKEKVIREKVIPYNAEIDKKKVKAIEELTNKFNADMNALRTTYENDKKTLETAGEQKKNEYQQNAVEVELATINATFANAKSELEKTIERLGG